MNRIPIIVVANQKGGVGKTTTTFNLGAALANRLYSKDPKQNRKVLLIDLDPQGNLTKSFLREEPATTAADIFTADQASPQLAETYKTNLLLLPADRSLSREAESITADFVKVYRLKEYIERLENISLVMIDTPPTLGGLTMASFIAATHLLIPISAHLYSLQGTKDLLDTFRRVKERLNTCMELVGVLISDFDQRTALANEIADQVTETFHGKLFKTRIMHSVKIEEAAVKRQAVVDDVRHSDAIDAYKKLAEEVLTRIGVWTAEADA